MRPTVVCVIAALVCAMVTAGTSRAQCPANDPIECDPYDINRDGKFDIVDHQLLFDMFFNEDPCADLDQNGVFDFFDLDIHIVYELTNPCFGCGTSTQCGTFGGQLPVTVLESSARFDTFFLSHGFNWLGVEEVPPAEFIWFAPPSADNTIVRPRITKDVSPESASHVIVRDDSGTIVGDGAEEAPFVAHAGHAYSINVFAWGPEYRYGNQGQGFGNGMTGTLTIDERIVKSIDTRERTVSDGTPNDVLHHTNQYVLPHAPPTEPPDPDDRTILRRGQQADFDIEVYEPFDPAVTELRLAVTHTFDGAPQSIAIKVYPDLASIPTGEWGCTILTSWPWPSGPADPNDPTPTRVGRVRMLSPPDAAIGEYTLSVWPTRGSGNQEHVVGEWTDPKPLVFLFNPWNEGDRVYMPIGAERDEYVTNGFGAVWIGATTRTRIPLYWKYEQFDADVFIVTQGLLAGLNAGERSSPAAVSERLAARIRQGNAGLLFGRWDGDYHDGTPPRHWTGSEEIFRTYRQTGATVRYGQCWVFAGVLTSSLRTLGIPSRPVTNYESAHAESATNLVVGRCWTHDLGTDTWTIDGPVWNFHAWCEATCVGGLGTADQGRLASLRCDVRVWAGLRERAPRCPGRPGLRLCPR